MKSRITIEVDFENGNQPVIQILKQNSEDVRDGLLSHFTQQFGGSSWCQIKWVDHYKGGGNEDINRIHISPIKEQDLGTQASVMLEQHLLNGYFKKESTGEKRAKNRLDLMSVAEQAITFAMKQVENIGASVELTNAVIKLSEARDLVYEHLESSK